ncbi:MAG: cobalamin B12-binding domain-containing protein [Candidatus Hodarchaeaceae archaeon]|nr:cobalamin B12-binding domain-containing protein [Candidatus Hodarchaeaceae archaeon]
MLLINPPIGTQLKGINAAGLSEPLGLLYIAAVLERRGIEVTVLDGAAEGITQEELGRRISEFNPKVIGIACMMTELCPDSIETVKTARQAIPEAKIVVGGHHASFVADKIIETSPGR